MCEIFKLIKVKIQNHREDIYKIGFFSCVIVYAIWLFLVLYFNSTNPLYVTTALLAIPSFLVAVVTFLYVLLTRQLVIMNQSLFDAQTEPVVIAYLNEERVREFKVIHLIIENIGSGIAKNVKFNVTPQGLKTLSNSLDDISAIKNGILLLGPKQRMHIPFGLNCKSPFQITINYQNQIGVDKCPQSFDLDPSITIDL